MGREEAFLWNELGFSLMRLYHLLQKEEKELAFRHQLGTTHVEMLYLLSRLGAGEDWLPVRRVYSYFALTQPAIGRILRHLAYWKYVELRRDKADRRCLLVRLLPAAYTLLEELEALRAHIVRSAFPDMPVPKLRQWIEGLRRATFAAHTNGEAAVGLPL